MASLPEKLLRRLPMKPGGPQLPDRPISVTAEPGKGLRASGAVEVTQRTYIKGREVGEIAPRKPVEMARLSL